MQLYAIARLNKEPECGHTWELCGVYDSKAAAVAHCTEDSHCVMPVKLNEFIEHHCVCPGAWYPKLQDEPAT